MMFDGSRPEERSAEVAAWQHIWQPMNRTSFTVLALAALSGSALCIHTPH
jgi:hypothetical protein